MGNSKVSNFFKDVKTGAAKHSPEILMGLGIGGMITTVGLAINATPKALKSIEEEKKKMYKDKLTPIETVKVTWKYYIPMTVTGVFSIACVVGSNSVNAKRNAAIATAYKLSETALAEYKDKVVETIGEKKEKDIREKIAKDKVNNTSVGESKVLITGSGDTLIMDGVSMRIFKSDLETVKKTINEINRRMLSEMYISLNEFYIALGLDTTDIGDDLGWNIDGGLIEPDFSPHLTRDGRPCIMMSYLVAPRYDFSKLC